MSMLMNLNNDQVLNVMVGYQMVRYLEVSSEY